MCPAPDALSLSFLFWSMRELAVFHLANAPLPFRIFENVIENGGKLAIRYALENFPQWITHREDPERREINFPKRAKCTRAANWILYIHYLSCTLHIAYCVRVNLGALPECVCGCIETRFMHFYGELMAALSDRVLLGIPIDHMMNANVSVMCRSWSRVKKWEMSSAIHSKYIYGHHLFDE